MLLADGGGNSDPYQIKTNSVAGGAGAENSMNYQQIMQILHGLKGHEVAGAAQSFRNLGDTLNTVAAKLAAEGDKLGGENWSGAAASAAMAKFQQLHDQAAYLAAQAHTTANVMDWVGNDVMPKFASIPSPQVMGTGGQAAAGAAAGSAIMPGVGTALGAGAAALFGGNGQAKADQAARQYMAALNNHLATANNTLPASTAGPSSAGPNPGNLQGTNWNGSGSGTGGSGAGSPYAGVGGTNGPGAGGAGSPYAPPATGHANFAKLPTGNGGGGNMSLQSVAPPPTAPTTSPFAPGSPAGPSTANPFNPVTMVPGGPGAAGRDVMPGEGGLPGEGALGENGLRLGKNGLPGEGGALGEGAAGGASAAEGSAMSGAGTAGAASAEGAAGAAGEAVGAEAAGAAGGEGAGMMPMGGMGGGGSQDKERQREAWMHEDESIWGVPDENIGPVIG